VSDAPGVSQSSVAKEPNRSWSGTSMSIAILRSGRSGGSPAMAGGGRRPLPATTQHARDQSPDNDRESSDRHNHRRGHAVWIRNSVDLSQGVEDPEEPMSATKAPPSTANTRMVPPPGSPSVCSKTRLLAQGVVRASAREHTPEPGTSGPPGALASKDHDASASTLSDRLPAPCCSTSSCFPTSSVPNGSASSGARR
jgi:hypothetical protein